MDTKAIKWSDIDACAVNAFTGIIKEDSSVLEGALTYKKELHNSNPMLAQMFGNDFSYYWNKLQVNHLLKTGMLIDVQADIDKQPAVWIMTWAEHAKNSVKKIDLGEDLDLRKYPFEKMMVGVEKLSSIFNYLYEKNPQNAKNVHDMAENLLPYASDYIQNKADEKKQSQNYFLQFNYHLAILKCFNTALDDDTRKSCLEKVLNSYYGRYLKNNGELFQKYLSNGQDINTQLNKKKELLSLRDEDIYYWRFFTSVSNGKLEEVLAKEIDIEVYNKQVDSVAKTIYIQNNYITLHDQLPQKEIKQVTKKTMKI